MKSIKCSERQWSQTAFVGERKAEKTAVETQRKAEIEKLLRTLLQTGWCQCIATENGVTPPDSRTVHSRKKCCCALTQRTVPRVQLQRRQQVPTRP